MSNYSYEESVRWMRDQPQYAELVEQCYLDEDNLAAAKRFAASEEFAEISSLLGLNGAGRRLKILDLGCGNGIASYAFASAGQEVYALDPDESEDVGLGAAARLARAVGGAIETVKSFAEELPFPDAAFDVVYARQSLHHFGDLRRGLAECARILKPGGKLLATREHVVSDDEQLQQFLDEHILHRLHGGENAYRLEEYRAALESAGLRVAKCLGTYDTVINHFPQSNAELRSQFYNATRARYGRVVAALLRRLPFAEKSYRRRLSRGCTFPGRPYSFLCVKDGDG